MKKSILTLALGVLLLMATALTVSANPAEATTPVLGHDWEWNTPETRATVTMTLEDVAAARMAYNIERSIGTINSTPLTSNEQQIVFELELFRLINIERANYGLNPLVWNDDLARDSRLHATNMATVGILAHTRREFAEQTGTNHLWVTDLNHWANGGSASTPDVQVRNWMQSPGHRANILNPELTSMGAGVDSQYMGSVHRPRYRLLWYAMFSNNLERFPDSLVATCPCPATGTASCPCIAQTTPSTPAQTPAPTTPQTPTTPNQTPAPPAANQAPVPTPTPQPTPAPTPAPPAATVEATTTITHTGINTSRNGTVTVSLTYTRSGNRNPRSVNTCGSGRALRESGVYVSFTHRNEGDVLIITNNATGETFRLNPNESVTLRGN